MARSMGHRGWAIGLAVTLAAAACGDAGGNTSGADTASADTISSDTASADVDDATTGDTVDAADDTALPDTAGADTTVADADDDTTSPDTAEGDTVEIDTTEADTTPACPSSALACHGACFGATTAYGQVCGDSCCPVEPLARSFEAPAVPDGQMWVELLFVDAPTRVSLDLSFDDGSCEGWDEPHAANALVEVVVIDMSSGMLVPFSRSRRATTTSPACHRLDVQLEPGIYGVTITPETAVAVPAFHAELTTAAPLAPVTGTVSASATVALDEDTKSFAVTVDALSRVYVATRNDGRCRSGSVRIGTASSPKLVTTPTETCADADVLLAPGTYEVSALAQFGHQSEALVLIDPVSTTTAAASPGAPVTVGPIAAGTAARLDLELIAGAYDYTVTGDGCGAANLRALRGEAVVLADDAPNGCPRGTLYLREDGARSLLLFGDWLAETAALEVTVGARRAIDDAFIDADVEITLGGLDITHWDTDVFHLRVASEHLVTLTTDELLNDCEGAGIDTDLAILTLEGVEVASDDDSGEGNCAALTKVLQGGDYRIEVDRKIGGYRLTVDL